MLAAIYRIAYGEDISDTREREKYLGNTAEYPLCLGYGAFAVRELLRQTDASLILGGSQAVGIAVGFDSGDFVILGEFCDDGLRPTIT